MYINDLWCRQYSVKYQICDQNVEMLGMTLRPFYLPREFGCILLFVVYAPPNAKAAKAANIITDCVHELQLKYPDAPAIVVGDMNQCHLDSVLPGFVQYVKNPTRKNNILDKCFVNIKDAYISKCRPPILNSDHNVIHMIPVYKTKFKRTKPEKKVIRIWTNDSKDQLRACFDWTDWSVFQEGSLDERTTVINDYINFCVQLLVPTKEIKIYPNNKLYVTKDIKRVINKRNLAFNNKDTATLRQTEKELRIKLREAKSKHRQDLENTFKTKNSKKVWDTMKSMTGMRSPNKSIVTGNDYKFANDLNSYFTRFESSDSLDKCNRILANIQPGPLDRINITADEVRKIFKATNTKKAEGPDKCSPFILKNFAAELVPAWQPVFQLSIDTHTVPIAWKTSHIKPLPKIQSPKEHKDYRPIALTSVIVKALERLLLKHLQVICTNDKLDSFQFAYKTGCGTEDAVATLVHIITKHLDKPHNYVRALFLDYSSAFNTIQPNILLFKMYHLKVNPYLIHWYASFLTNRVQLVKVNKTLSSAISTNVGAPQGCVSSALLFTLYTDDCRSTSKNQYVLKYSDDTVLLTLLTDSDSSDLHQQGVNKIAIWSKNNALEINTKKTEEIVFSSKSIIINPIIINNELIKQVQSYKYLGVMIDATLSWKHHIDYICKKTKQRIYFLRRLRSFGATRQILLLFYNAVILSVLQYCNAVWYSCLSSSVKSGLKHLIKVCSKIVGQHLEGLYEITYHNNTMRLAKNILSDVNHVLNSEYVLLPSARRYSVPRFNKVRLKHSFVHQSILKLNKEPNP